MNTLGMRLRELREDMELSQLEVAEKLNCSDKMISNYELDKRSPDYRIIIKICDLFDVSADFLLGRADSPKFHHESVLSNDETQLLKYFKKLPQSYKKDVIRYCRLNLSDIQNS